MTSILVVDDNPQICALYAHFFRRLNCRVEQALHPDDALDYLQTGNPFDLIFVDYRLPQMDGLELLKQIKSVYPDSKVILISAAPPPDLEREARHAGATACLFGIYDANRLQHVFAGVMS